MNTRFMKLPLTEYIEHAMAQGVYDKLPEGTFVGRIPSCVGVIAFGDALHGCQEELRSVLEDWLLVGLKLGHELPVIAGIDLNTIPENESVEAS